MILNVEVRLVRDEDGNKWRPRIKSSLVGESQPGLIHGKETGVVVPANERALYLFRSNLYLELGDEIEALVRNYVTRANAKELELLQQRAKAAQTMKKEEKK